MLDCAFYMCEESVLDHSLTGKFTEKSGNHHPWYAPYGEFAAEDGNVVIAVSQEDEWESLCHTFGMDAKDPRFCSNALRVQNREALTAEIERATRARKRYEIESVLCAAGVPAAAVQSLQEFDNQPQTRALNVITEIDQEGVGPYTVTNTPILFSKTPVNPNASAAGFPGANSVEILENLGYSRERIEGLLAGGAVHQAG